MSIELAVALGAIATKTLVAELIQGGSMNRAGWANVAGEVVDTLITTSGRQEAGLQELGQKIDQVGKRIDGIAVREFEQHMAAGRRYLRDLPVEWRTERDRRDLIHDARGEFVRAVAIAELDKDLDRRVSAEVAIAGCWLWVPSLKDVKNTIGVARQVLEEELLFGATWPTASYRDVLQLCRSFGEQPSYTGTPILPRNLGGWPMPTPGARIAVQAREKQWVGCAGVALKIDRQEAIIANPAARLSPPPVPPTAAAVILSALRKSGEAKGLLRAPSTLPQTKPESPRSSGSITITVGNTRAEWISVSRTARAVIVRLPTKKNILPSENRIAPGDVLTLTLPPTLAYNQFPYVIPLMPAIGFVLPQPLAA